MSTDEKAQVLEKVEPSHGLKRNVTAELDVPKNTCSRWRARQRQGRLDSILAIDLAGPVALAATSPA